MRTILSAALTLPLLTLPVAADPDKDESGKGRGRGGYDRYGYYGYEEDRKVKFRTPDGCEVERKWKKGEYEEKIKCKPGRHGYRD